MLADRWFYSILFHFPALNCLLEIFYFTQKIQNIYQEYEKFLLNEIKKSIFYYSNPLCFQWPSLKNGWNGLWRSSSPPPLLKQILLKQDVQDHIQASFYYLPRRSPFCFISESKEFLGIGLTVKCSLSIK